MSTVLVNNYKFLLYLCSMIDAEVEYVSKIPYVSAFGSLIYVMVCTRPNLAKGVSLCTS